MRTLVELCAGTAAITFACFGARPPVPMAGSKRSLAAQILPLLGLSAPPDRVILNDAGEWGRTLAAGFSYRGWLAIAACMDVYAERDERELFDDLRQTPPDFWDRPQARAACHLYLQTRTYRDPARPHPTVDRSRICQRVPTFCPVHPRLGVRMSARLVLSLPPPEPPAPRKFALTAPPVPEPPPFEADTYEMALARKAGLDARVKALTEERGVLRARREHHEGYADHEAYTALGREIFALSAVQTLEKVRIKALTPAPVILSFGQFRALCAVVTAAEALLDETEDDPGAARDLARAIAHVGEVRPRWRAEAATPRLRPQVPETTP